MIIGSAIREGHALFRRLTINVGHIRLLAMLILIAVAPSTTRGQSTPQLTDWVTNTSGSTTIQAWQQEVGRYGCSFSATSLGWTPTTQRKMFSNGGSVVVSISEVQRFSFETPVDNTCATVFYNVTTCGGTCSGYTQNSRRRSLFCTSGNLSETRIGTEWVWTCSGNTCPVPPLTPITDPAARVHEDGRYAAQPDLDNLNSRTQTGMACILQRAAGEGIVATITSAYRPAQYQSHLQEVYDKWQLLKDNAQPECQEVKDAVRREFNKHRVIRRPVNNSQHSTGNAVDIAGIPGERADSIAAACNMYRPEPSKDRVHFVPLN